MAIHTKIFIKNSYATSCQGVGQIYLFFAAVTPLVARWVFQLLRFATVLHDECNIFPCVLFPLRPLTTDMPAYFWTSWRTTIAKCIGSVAVAATFLAASYPTDIFTSVSVFQAPANGTSGHARGYLAPTETTNPTDKHCYMFDLPEEEQYRTCSKVLSELQHDTHHMESAAETWQSENCSHMELILLEAVLSDKPLFVAPPFNDRPTRDGPLRPWHHMQKSITALKGNRTFVIGTHYVSALEPKNASGDSGALATFHVRVLDPEGKPIEKITANTVVSQSHGMKTGDFVIYDGRIFLNNAKYSDRDEFDRMMAPDKYSFGAPQLGKLVTRDRFWIRAVDDNNLELYDTEAHAKDTTAQKGQQQLEGILRRQGSKGYGTLTKARPVVKVSIHSVYVKSHGLSTGDQVTYLSAGEACLEELIERCGFSECNFFTSWLPHSSSPECLQDKRFFVKSTDVDKLELYRYDNGYWGSRVRFAEKETGKYGMLVKLNGVVDDVQVSETGFGYRVGETVVVRLTFALAHQATIWMKLRDEDIATVWGGRLTPTSTADFELMPLLSISFKAASAILEGTAMGLMCDFLSTVVISIPNQLQLSTTCVRYSNEFPVLGAGVFPILTSLRWYHYIMMSCTLSLSFACIYTKFCFGCMSRCHCDPCCLPANACTQICNSCCCCCPSQCWLCQQCIQFWNCCFFVLTPGGVWTISCIASVWCIAGSFVIALAGFLFVTLILWGIPPFCATLVIGFGGNMVQKVNAVLQLWKGLENLYFNMLQPLSKCCCCPQQLHDAENRYYKCCPQQLYDASFTNDEVTITIAKPDLVAMAGGKLRSVQLIKEKKFKLEDHEMELMQKLVEEADDADAWI